MADTQTRKTSSPLLVALAWAVVILPTAWGLSLTAKNAMKLFTTSTSAVTAPVK
jgi:superfamily II DNA or RNA helicase